MKIRKPEYYDQFVCIADRCSRNCCQEWKIGVDDETNRRWKKLPPPEGAALVKQNLSLYTRKKDGERILVLDKEKRCPFLDEKGLCMLVSAYGEGCLSETCTIFPREIHRFPGYLDYTLMPTCPAVIDLLKECGQVRYLEEKGDDTILTRIRTLFGDWMRSEEYSPETNFKHLFFMGLELERECGGDSERLKESMLKEYEEISLRRELAEAIDAMETDPVAGLEERNELFLDLAVNYRAEGMYRDVLEGAAAIAEQLEETGCGEDILKKQHEFVKQFAGFQGLMRNFLTAEIESNCLLPGGDFSDMLVHLEWIALEYAVICHLIFLLWLKSGNLTYELVRDSIVIICRMTGYNEEDILEYLENSFEELIWDWGYLALILDF